MPPPGRHIITGGRRLHIYCAAMVAMPCYRHGVLEADERAGAMPAASRAGYYRDRLYRQPCRHQLNAAQRARQRTVS